jgi:hypothetical protein
MGAAALSADRLEVSVSFDEQRGALEPRRR